MLDREVGVDSSIRLVPVSEPAGRKSLRQRVVQSLNKAVREFETSPNAHLEVWACLTINPEIDPLQLKVTSADRKYGSLQFDGTLAKQSLLIPELQPDLPMRLHEYEIRAWRLNEEQPVYRLRQVDSSPQG